MAPIASVQQSQPQMVPSYSLGEIARALGGEILGDPDLRVSRVSTLENASSDAIAFFAQDRFLGDLQHTRARAVILGFSNRDITDLPRIVCGNPHAYFARVCALLHPAQPAVPSIHPSATIHPSAKVGVSISVGPYSVIGSGACVGEGAVIGAHCVLDNDAEVGAGTVLFPGVVVYQACRIGARCVLHAGVVIGADGFGNAWESDNQGGHWVKVPQLGRVLIGDDVEIGANTTIDRGAIDDTVIGEGVRLDNLIMIAHNVHIGAHTAIAACSGVAGSTRIGRRCRIGGAVGIAGHLTIADDVEIAGKTLITKSITVPGSYSGGYPFEESRQWRRNAVQIRHLDDLAKQVKQMELRLARLEKKDP